MISLVKRNETITKNTIEEYLKDLSRYGKPRIFQTSDGGWNSSVEMHVLSLGASFEVRSEYDHKTALGAVRCCHERVIKALKDLR